MKTIYAIALVALTGCSTVKYGDGKLGTIPLSPAVNKLADQVDGQIPGGGKILRDWFSAAGRERIPDGYSIVWDSYLPNGQKINRGEIIDIPRLQAVDPKSIVVQPVPDTQIMDLLKQINEADKEPAK